MATASAARPGRTIAVLAVLTVLVFALIWVVAPDKIGKETLTTKEKYQPRLGLDLEGGTSIILTPRRTSGSGSVPKDSLDQAVSIIRSRVDSFGVAESEVTTAGDNIVISIPGKQDKNILATVQQTAELRFRPVLAATSGAPIPQNTPSPTGSPSGSPSPSGSASGTATPTPSTTTNNAVVPRALRKAGSTTPAPSPSPTPTPSPTGETGTSPDSI